MNDRLWRRRFAGRCPDPQTNRAFGGSVRANAASQRQAIRAERECSDFLNVACERRADSAAVRHIEKSYRATVSAECNEAIVGTERRGDDHAECRGRGVRRPVTRLKSDVFRAAVTAYIQSALKVTIEDS
jgi:hypothetical protein